MQIKSVISLVRCLGPGWVAFRCWKSLSERFGYWEKRIPSSDWEEIGKQYGDPTNWSSGTELNEAIDARGARFFFDGKTLPANWIQLPEASAENSAMNLLTQNLDGKFPFFSGPYQAYQKLPNWFRNPITDAATPQDIHFSKINEFGIGGDIKAIWELNRFTFVFDLARSYARTGDPRCGERFWELFEHWYENNTPYNGVNWKCGQESGLRMLAVVFGYFTFRHHPSFTGELPRKLMNFLAATGMRIERHISYAISQKNNHGISEAVALCTIGTLFPNLKSASRWQSRGISVLQRLCQELIYDDGGFCQHSANYHRLLLHLLAWHVELANVNNVEVPSTITSRFKLATQFILELMDLNSGRVPRYGNDDGALLFPLSDCDYQDFRPVVWLSCAILDRCKVAGRGPWDEDLFWFGLSALAESESEPKQSHSFNALTAGCHTLRSAESFAFVRAGGFVHRPCQLDMMHVDLWSAGNNVAIDAGTYSYNGDGIWKNIPFSRGDYHNSLTVDGKEPARRVSNFLFVPWPQAQLVQQSESFMLFKRTMSFETADSVVHWRLLVKNVEDSWLVLDRMEGKNLHDYRLHWLLGGEIQNSRRNGEISLRFSNGRKYNMIFACSDIAESSMVTADSSTGRGFFAPKYLQLATANSFALETTATTTQFVSLFGPNLESLEQIAHKDPAAFDLGLLDCNGSKNDSDSSVAKFVQEMGCV